MDGILTFGPTGSSTNFGIPNDVAPNAVLAAWWDWMGVGGGFTGRVAYQITGSAPNRKFVAQYSDIGSVYSLADTYARLNFQISIQETTGLIEFAYGPMQIQGAPRQYDASLGIESPDGRTGIQPFVKSPNLDHTDFPENGCVISFRRCTASPTPTPSLTPSPTFAPAELLERIRKYTLGETTDSAGLDINADGNVDVGALLAALY